MVLFKRKAIEFFPPPETPSDLDIDVWYVPETKEWFTDYDDYLKRLDYYNTRKFVCESTGITGYTFWELLEIETQEIKKVEKFFPEAVKEPILRYAQFSLIQRIDLLIDDIYYKFKNDFFPGDQVNVKITGTALKEKGVIKEKLRFNAITLPNGQQRKAYCQYRVLLNSGEREITCDENDLARDRMCFTKLFIRGFLKLSMMKSPRVGSPWVVKENYAKKYRITADYPADLTIFKEDLDQLPIRKRPYDNLQVNLQPLYPLPQLKKRKLESDEDNEASFRNFPFAYVQESIPSNALDIQYWRQIWFNALNGMVVFIDTQQLKPNDLELKENVIKLFSAVGAQIIYEFDPVATNLIITKRTYSPKFNYQLGDYFHQLNPLSRKVWNFDKVLRFFKSLDFTFDNSQLIIPNITYDKTTKLRPIVSLDPSMKNMGQVLLKQQTINNHLLPLYPKGATLDQILKINLQQSRDGSVTPLVQQSKKVQLAEDLSLPFQINEEEQKPSWKRIENDEITKVSELLESWCFLNVYRKALLLDNFTLDDYITAMSWTRDDLECQLLEEIFCATMKCVLNDDVKVGGNNTHGISKDENGVGDGEQYLILIPRKGGYQVIKELEDEEEEEEEEEKEHGSEVKTENGSNGTHEVKEELDGESSANGVKDELKEDIPEDTKPKKEEESEEEEEEDDEEQITNNVHKLLFYKKKTWQERLRKRTFKDGQWLIVLVGILSLVEHVPRYAETVDEIFSILAPVDLTASTGTLETQFYNHLPVDLRISAITIICELLTSGVVIRNFIDKSLEDATQLRKERIEIVREYKLMMEKASNINKECREQVVKNKKSIKVDKKPVDPNLAKKSRGGRPPALKDAPTEEELAFLKVDKAFAKILDERIGYLDKLNEAKLKKKEIEFKLNELDVQRMNYVGRDRLYNRYWWFEINGLPTMRSSKKVSEDDEDQVVDDSFDEDDSDDEEEMKDETYLVGRLFVQGPSDDDRLRFLDINDEFLDKWFVLEKDEDSESGDEEDEESEKSEKPEKPEKSPKETMELFQQKCNEILGLKFEEKVIKSKDDKVLVDEYGATSIDLTSKTERKVIEEMPDPLLRKSDWRYIDTPADMDKLLNYLNKAGERENLLFKELDLLKEGIKVGMEARIKLLGLEKKSNDELKLEEKINSIEISDVEDEEMDDDDDDDDDDEGSNQFSTPNDSDLDDAEYDEERSELISSRRQRTRASRRTTDKVTKPETRRRSLRNGNSIPVPSPSSSSSKSSKLATLKKSRRQRLKLHEQKIHYKERLMNQLENLRNNRNEVRCLEWVNSSCINATGTTHFGGVKENKLAKGRGRR